ncbi:MAG: transporter substrate-binding domain-containing protein [Nitrospirae bacterium]|nr:transporter substrate-binding domain-containing protein [Nitrospirota bacterium]
MRRLSFLAILAVFLWAGSACAETIVLNTAHTYPLSTPDCKGYEDLIVNEAFRRLGMEVKIVHLPSERALVNANKGIDDGNFSRIAGLEKNYSNLVMVPEQIATFEFAAFARDPSIRIDGWESLQSYSVGIVTGWKILEANVTKTRLLTKVSSADALFDLLVHGRVDIVVFDSEQGKAIMRRNGISGVTALKPLLASTDMFIYLNSRHAALAPKLAAVLRGMKRDGSFARIVGSVKDSD